MGPGEPGVWVLGVGGGPEWRTEVHRIFPGCRGSREPALPAPTHTPAPSRLLSSAECGQGLQDRPARVELAHLLGH